MIECEQDVLFSILSPASILWHNRLRLLLLVVCREHEYRESAKSV